MRSPVRRSPAISGYLRVNHGGTALGGRTQHDSDPSRTRAVQDWLQPVKVAEEHAVVNICQGNQVLIGRGR